MAAPDVGTEQHNKLRDLVLQKIHASERLLHARAERWRESERSYRLYVDPDQIQGDHRGQDEQTLLHPYPNSVVIPLSYATAQTLVAFMVGLFSSSWPYFRIGNRNPESWGGAKAQQLLVSYQLDYWGWVSLLYQTFLDSFRYGFSPIKCCWKEEYRQQTITRQVPVNLAGQEIMIPVREQIDVEEFQGNYLETIDPYTFYPDLQHPIAMLQEGNYCGESVTRSYYYLLKKEAEGLYENVREIPRQTLDLMKALGQGGTLFNGSDRERIVGINQHYGEVLREDDAGVVLVETLVMDLIPEKYGVGSDDLPMRYMVTLANRAVIIRAEEYPYSHGDYYYSVVESSPDLHSFLNPGVLELMEPISQHISWLYNSHIENVRASLNNQLIVDPDRVNIDDILSPSAGKIIRLRPKYYGSSIQGAVQQLAVGDVTGRNIETAQVLMGFLERLSAANDNMQGQKDDQRRTATENAMIANMSTSRLRMFGRVVSDRAFKPLVRQMVHNNMELLTSEQYVRIAGSLEQEYQAIGRSVQGGVMLTPEDLQGLYDYPVSDATSALDPMGYARVWMQIMDMTLKHPLISQQVDHLALFKEVVGSMGISDFSRFLLPQQVQVMGPQQLEQQVQRGNLVPSPIQPPQTPTALNGGTNGAGLGGGYGQ